MTITNDEELIIALTEMPGPLYKLNLSLKGNKKPAVTAETSEAGEKKVEAVHYGVTCDGCNMVPITGVRYVYKLRFGSKIWRNKISTFNIRYHVYFQIANHVCLELKITQKLDTNINLKYK